MEDVSDGELEDISEDIGYYQPTIVAPQHQIFSEGCQCWLLQKLLQTTVATVRMLQFLQQFGSDQLAISMPGTHYALGVQSLDCVEQKTGEDHEGGCSRLSAIAVLGKDGDHR